MVAFGPERKKVMLCLPYTGVACDRIRRQLTRIVSAVAPSIHLLVIFKPLFKLSVLSRLKCPFTLLSNSNVVYRVDCSKCSEFYIGMTTRRLEQRMAEHADSSTSALYQHRVSSNHIVNFEKTQILATSSSKYGL